MKILKKTLLLVLILWLASCNDFIDEVKPETSQEVSSLLQSVDDLDVLLNGSYGALAGPANFDTFQKIQVLLSDFFTAYPGNRNSWLNGREDNAYTYRFANMDYDLQSYVIQWCNLSMNMANTVIKALNEGTAGDDRRLATQGDRLRGEALLLRTVANWEMTLLLGKQYHESTLNDPAGLYRDKPILSPSDIPSPQRTVGFMYDKMIEDALEAESLLPEVYDEDVHPLTYKIRFRKDAATAMLAKLYFQMNDFDNALQKVNDLLGPVNVDGSSKYPLADDYNEVFRRIGNHAYGPDLGTEIIFAFEGSTAQKLTRDSKWGTYRWTRPSGSRSQKRLMLGQPYKDLIDQSKDRRFTELVEVDEDGNWWQKKFDTPFVNLPLFRAAEFHLIRAEILARQGNLTDALIELNLVRERAGLDPIESSNADEVISEVIDERGREMILEWNRFYDMKRLGALTDGAIKVPVGEKTADDKSFIGGLDFIDWDSDLLQYVVPTNEKQYNSGF